MNTNEQKAFLDGEQAVWISMLGKCIKELGYDDPEAKTVNYFALQ